jgi:CheY-specific phosphatase CheX
MNAAYIRPVVMAVQNVFETMIKLPVVAGKQSFKKEKRPTTDVISMITLSGPVSGFISLGLSSKLALLLASQLLECEISEASDGCIDAIG